MPFGYGGVAWMLLVLGMHQQLLLMGYQYQTEPFIHFKNV
jgi:hypothetical protein